MWIATTVAPTTVSPLASVILPLIDDVVTCAKDATVANAHTNASKNDLTNCFIIDYKVKK
jgi:hypothetical protein